MLKGYVLISWIVSNCFMLFLVFGIVGVIVMLYNLYLGLLIL